MLKLYKKYWEYIDNLEIADFLKGLLIIIPILLIIVPIPCYFAFVLNNPIFFVLFGHSFDSLSVLLPILGTLAVYLFTDGFKAFTNKN